jgi:membrane-associated phospholipid phosphatase
MPDPLRWHAFNFVDRLYVAYFIGLGIVMIIFGESLPTWPLYLAIHAASLGIIAALVHAAPRSRIGRFFHGWYPLLMFILAFEEVSRLSLLVVDHWQDGYILALEAWLFPVPPTVWFGRIASPLVTEIMEIGYFSYFGLLIIVAGTLYRWPSKRPFRQVMAASVISYLICYVVFILFPTEGPAYTLAAQHTVELRGGPFHWLVLLIQKHAGVHGNAFPSSHVAAGFAALLFAWKYAPRLGWALAPFVLFLCLGAVYDRYHYASDVIGGLAVGAFAYWLVFRIERSPQLLRATNLHPPEEVHS